MAFCALANFSCNNSVVAENQTNAIFSDTVKNSFSLITEKKEIVTDTFTTVTNTKPIYIANNSKSDIYSASYLQLKAMLAGQAPINFKKAVYIVENAFLDGKLNEDWYNTEIKNITTAMQNMIAQKNIGNYKTAPNWAAFTIMMDSLPQNNNKPMTYDFEDFMGEKDSAKMFVSKLLRTKSGNCHSLPSLYKILVEDLNGSAFLALAPMHLYIKHIDENGKWVNIELTNKSIPRDQWMIQQMSISLNAIQNKVYMNPLNEKETIAFCIIDLIDGYKAKHGYDDFVFEMANCALKYYPACVTALWKKSNYYLYEREKLLKKNNGVRNEQTDSLNKLYVKMQKQIDSIGFTDEDPEQYANWLKMVENEKQKRLNNQPK